MTKDWSRRSSTPIGGFANAIAFGAAISAIAVCIAPSAVAQTLPVAPAPTGDEAGVQEIVVTGSNIRRNANATAAALITQVGKEQIQGIGSISVEDVLNRVPSITSDLSASSNNNSTGGGAANVGVATVSLRNLGTARTLVLVNGRRFVSGVSANTGYGVDLNAIPTATIERIDVLTGGQSAIYGSDALAGVINIVTKPEFRRPRSQRVRITVRTWRGRAREIDATYGRNFGFGNAWVSADYANQEAEFSKDRPFSRDEQRFVDTNKDGIIDTIAVRDGPAHVPGAALFAPGLAIFGNGQKFNTNQPLLDSNFNRIGTTDYDNQNASRYLVAPFDRFYVASGLRIDVDSKSKLNLELNYTHTTSFVSIDPAPVSVISDIFRVPRGGTTGIDVTTSPYFVGSSAGAQLATALGTKASLDRATTFRRFVEFGPRTVSNRRDLFRIAADFTHDFNSSLTLDSSADRAP